MRSGTMLVCNRNDGPEFKGAILNQRGGQSRGVAIVRMDMNTFGGARPDGERPPPASHGPHVPIHVMRVQIEADVTRDACPCLNKQNMFLSSSRPKG